MAEIKKRIDVPQRPIITSFAIERSKNFRSYHVRINFRDDSVGKKIILYKIFKSKLTKPLLEKDYNITQLAAEKITGAKNYNNKNTILYDKKAFSQNSRVNLFGSGQSSQKQDEKPLERGVPESFEIGVVRNNKNKKEYSFVDENIKFGETYIYSVAAVDSNYSHSFKSLNQVVNVEDIEHPDPPRSVTIKPTNEGVSIFVEAQKNSDIAHFDIWRKRALNKDWRLVARIDSNKDHASYEDELILPGILYQYKVYSVDFFGNVSFSSFQTTGSFNKLFERKGMLPQPFVKFTIENGIPIFEGFKNHKNNLGHIIERQDTWRKELGFSRKTKESIEWPGILFFPSGSASYTFKDQTAKLGRTYRYKITSVSNNTLHSTYLILPILKIINNTESFTFYSNVPSPEKNDGKFSGFELLPFLSKKDPPIIKATWQTTGDWDYISIKNHNKEVFKIDNIHETAYINIFKKGVKYSLTIDLCNSKGEVLDSIKSLTLNV